VTGSFCTFCFQLCSAIQWLCEQSLSQTPVIKSQPLFDFLDDNLTNHFIIPALQTVAERRKEGLGHLVSTT
jgi:hypothetical protein